MSGRWPRPIRPAPTGAFSSWPKRGPDPGERIGNQPVQVLVRGGHVYPASAFVLGPQDSGTPRRRGYAAFEREKPVFSGGRVSQASGRLATCGKRHPEVKAGEWYFRQCFVNGAGQRARSPNRFYRIARADPRSAHTKRQTGRARQVWILPGALQPWSRLHRL